MVKALVLLAHGSEEMEAVITCDILARANIHVNRASVEIEDDLIIHCANGMKIVADIKLDSVMSNLSEFSIIILPGGMKAAKTFCTVIFFFGIHLLIFTYKILSL